MPFSATTWEISSWRYEIQDVFPRNWARILQNVQFLHYFTMNFKIFSLNLTGGLRFFYSIFFLYAKQTFFSPVISPSSYQTQTDLSTSADRKPYKALNFFLSIPFAQKAWKTCVHTGVSDKNQSCSQTKGFMHIWVQKILEACERVANIFLHPGANTYICIIYIPCVNQRMWTGLMIHF